MSRWNLFMGVTFIALALILTAVMFAVGQPWSAAPNLITLTVGVCQVLLHRDQARMFREIRVTRMSSGRHRKPRWHDRPRAWLRNRLNRRWEEEEQELTDGHGNHISGDLPGYEYDEPAPDGVYQAARLADGTLLRLDGEPAPSGYNPAWMNPAFTPDVSRPGNELTLGECPPRTGRFFRGDAQGSGPGHLSAFTVPFGAPSRDDPRGLHPRTPHPAPRPVTLWRPRECGGRITLAGAW